MMNLFDILLFLVLVGWILQWEGGARRGERHGELELDPGDERERAHVLLRDLQPRPRRRRVLAARRAARPAP